MNLLKKKYSPDNGRPSMDPIMLIKIPFIQYLYGMKKVCGKQSKKLK